MTKKIIFNLTTSKHWRATPVGIVRVERELAKFLYKNNLAIFVYWDKEKKTFIHISDEQVELILSDDWCSQIGGISEKFDQSNKFNEFVLLGSDIYISIGLDWDLCPVGDVYQKLNTSQCKVIMACYDLVPILFPEFCVNDNFDQLFIKHFVDMAYVADSIFVISENSKKDLIEFWVKHEVNIELPSINVLNLAGIENILSMPKIEEVDDSKLRHLKAGNPYILYVSTVEPRKNQRILLNIWRDLYSERGENCPRLVIVGAQGWAVNDLLDRMRLMPAYLADKIVWLNNVNDNLLIHIYLNSYFTVFPSLYEGWGLAATEAMTYGKICIISNNSSLEEATQGLMPSYHPLDYPGWKSEIEKLLDNKKYFNKLSNQIKNKYINKNWTEFSVQFFEKICLLKVNSNN